MLSAIAEAQQISTMSRSRSGLNRGNEALSEKEWFECPQLISLSEKDGKK
jgi:hypothetical protein